MVPSRDSFCVANDAGLSLKLQNVKMGEKRKKKSELYRGVFSLGSYSGLKSSLKWIKTSEIAKYKRQKYF